VHKTQKSRDRDREREEEEEEEEEEDEKKIILFFKLKRATDRSKKILLANSKKKIPPTGAQTEKKNTTRQLFYTF
jgi:hypothetical protein